MKNICVAYITAPHARHTCMLPTIFIFRPPKNRRRSPVASYVCVYTHTRADTIIIQPCANSGNVGTRRTAIRLRPGAPRRPAAVHRLFKMEREEIRKRENCNEDDSGAKAILNPPSRY